MDYFERLAQNAEVSEKALEKYLIAQATSRGMLALKFASSTATGFPDRLIVARGGLCAWCELKSRDGRLSPVQKVRVAQLRAMGQRVFVARSREFINEMLNDIETEASSHDNV